MMAAEPRRWHAGHAIVAGLGLLCALLLLRLITADRPQPPAMPQPGPPATADRSLLAGHDLFFGAGAAPGEVLPVTDLPFTLHGLRTDSVTGRGSAIIAGADGLQDSHAVGERLGDGVLLVAVAFDHVVLDRDGRREALWLDTSGDAPVQRYQPDELATTDAVAEPPPPMGLPLAQAPDGPGESTGAADMPAAPPDSESGG